MTTNDNYRYAKNAFDRHVAKHKCKAQELVPAGERCQERRELWQEMIRVAGDLGR